MTAINAPLQVEPQAAHSIRRIIPADEHVLWAANCRGPTLRQLHLYLILAIFIGVPALMSLLVDPGFIILTVPLAPGIIWYLAGEWFYVFAVTDRRVIFLRTLPPRSWVHYDFADIDIEWPRSHAGRGVIKFGWRHFRASGPWSHLTSQRSGMKGYIDNVPDIEAVRALIVDRISRADKTAP